ncbi:hypothetical protein Thein_1272 [Thermodesulfatator indicus DSM 15286]|uniref:Uncharacterized protein n=1 Tax=Thermodesulfatator indicus (strain DSM 15286 / JCM 11887 / CIR29812) TaxID=667014 RepID=F8A912_THEID|nr:hypothetical protein [Thermodesulfatator indicus]AEH45140.1 hypothetical protein Thein_1272 [Thermodesulfatator indicus DSM 15286]
MKNKKTTAWIGFAGAIIAALIGGLFMLYTKNGSSNSISIKVKNSKQTPIAIGNQNQISIENKIINKAKKIAIIDVIKDKELHLGDNVYPSTYGVSYNPLQQDIYPQGVRGIIYYDKKNKVFLSDSDRPTILGQLLVNFIEQRIRKIDFSCYWWVHAFNVENKEYKDLIKKAKNDPSVYMLGSTILVAKNRHWGNFYERYAAVGIARKINFVSELERAGINPKNKEKLKLRIILRAYHGGIRKGQPENFVVQINNFVQVIPSISRYMRDPEEISLEIPIDEVYFDKGNVLFLYVLPWVEERPQLILDGKVKKPAHFRDVGVTLLQIKIYEDV